MAAFLDREQVIIDEIFMKIRSVKNSAWKKIFYFYPMRSWVSITAADSVAFKENLLRYASQHSRCCVLESNDWQGSRNETIAAIGMLEEITPADHSFFVLQEFHQEKKDWLFGYLSYDLKNQIEDLSSGNFDGVGFPQMHFFRPRFVLHLKENSVRIGFVPGRSTEKEAKHVFQEILSQTSGQNKPGPELAVRARLSKGEYLEVLSAIKKHISRGDIYEMNYCMEFFSENAHITPAEVFLKLNSASLAPFSAFYRREDNYLLCASPERFLKKEGASVISQPMKGTAGRGMDPREDAEIIEQLRYNNKDQSENVMIVDLVRNDLSRTCTGVKVDELFGIYTFRQWHQMVSTVSGEVRKDVPFTDIIRNAFPMGSMTGAPKVRAMELIEQYEKTKRGLYSGAVGYITPDGNFDFNVVIRSIVYNASSCYLSFQAGSAITARSVPENEYEECLLKSKGMFEALGVASKKSVAASAPEEQPVAL